MRMRERRAGGTALWDGHAVQSSQLRNTIRLELDKIRVVDTHEHTEAVDFARTQRNQIFRTFSRSFIQHDLSNAGVSAGRWRATTQGDAAGWIGLRRYVDLCRNTGYFRCFLRAVRDLLDMDLVELTDENWERISEALVSANERPDWYSYVLRDRANIDVALWDRSPDEPQWPTMDPSLFLPTRRFDAFAWVASPHYRRHLQQGFGMEPATLADVLDMLDAAFDRAVAAGIAGVKVAAAYFRPLDFGPCDRNTASTVLSMPTEDIGPAEARIYENFIYGKIFEKCAEHGFPILMHTGMPSTGGLIQQGNPLALKGTIARFPAATFVLLHGGYPFTNEAASLAVTYPNVYVEGSWMPILTPFGYSRTLAGWLDVLPVERILAWGGDAIRVEMSYGSLVMAKDAAADVLAQRMEKGVLSETKAIDVACRIFRENARALFRTDENKDSRLGRGAPSRENVA
ncbi:MAG: amidohydrolase family protein [Planctomycetes bacterium]|nr:amidohydrolase family protein [Planctomycetota bacterium]